MAREIGIPPAAALSPRELEVLAHIRAGSDNLRIAAVLGITERTVKAHVHSLYRKLRVENRVQMALEAEGRLGASPRSAVTSLSPNLERVSELVRLRANVEESTRLLAELRRARQDLQENRDKLMNLVQALRRY